MKVSDRSIPRESHKQTTTTKKSQEICFNDFISRKAHLELPQELLLFGAWNSDKIHCHDKVYGIAITPQSQLLPSMQTRLNNITLPMSFCRRSMTGQDLLKTCPCTLQYRGGSEWCFIVTHCRDMRS